jgi:hypothetical protein
MITMPGVAKHVAETDATPAGGAGLVTFHGRAAADGMSRALAF